MSVDRKALVRAYKEARRPMGVFRIRNVQNGRALIGASVDLPSILNRHRAQLRLHSHRNEALQRDWDILGADAFAFETLDMLTPPEDDAGYDPAADLEALEAMWLEQLAPFGDRGYNRPPKGSA
jgi:hypothetical protein